MKQISVSITEVQHIASLTFSLSLETYGLHCIVGRNGVGKTTLVRAFRNLSNADTFIKTANPRIFRDESRIEYRIDESAYVFSFDAGLRSLNCRDIIPDDIRNAVSAELPMPFGARFNYAKSASEADPAIRIAIALQDYEQPHELVHFLSSIYASNKYDRLIEVPYKGRAYYAIEQGDGTYIREDYLSSGEFFLINLYRTIKNKARLIVIDEIDLSLDAAAQAKLVGWLREFCLTYECSVLFTTHSLAIMRTLADTELAYIEFNEGVVSIAPASYSYTKARLFGFSGWDRYILTEDVVLSGLVEFLVSKHCGGRFFEHKTIHIGGGSQVADLLKRNDAEAFLSERTNVIAILDGDQRNEAFATWNRVHLIPVESVEKEIFARYQAGEGFPFQPTHDNFGSPKEFFNHLRSSHIASVDEMYDYVVQANMEAFTPLITTIETFLRPAQ